MRNSVEIEVWLKRAGIKQVDIQKALKMANHVQVSNTIQGRWHNRRVLAWLRDNGCPVEFLDLPDSLKIKEAV